MKFSVLLSAVMTVVLGTAQLLAATQDDRFLLKTHWYQDGPFALFTPRHERVGCWSTAYAQILYFHRLQPEGHVAYDCSSGEKIDVDLDQHRFRWELFANEMAENTPKPAQEEMARYSHAVAAVVRKDFGTGSYKRLLNSVEDLQTHFAVEANIYVRLGDKVSMPTAELNAKLRSEKITNVVNHEQIVSLLKAEMAADRPVYFHFGNLKDFGHSTVIDGYRQERGRHLVHINYGAREVAMNKWYDLFAPISQPDDEALRAFVTIKPRAGGATPAALEGQLRTRLPELLKQHHVPAAAVAVIREGELAIALVVGEQEAGVPATTNTLFNVASLTKPVVAQAILTLVDRSQFDLDESLARYWIDPDVRNDPRHPALTARMVLSHETGFPNWRDGKPLQFGFNPGTGIGYSGEGFEYLRQAAEKKTERSLEQFVADTVLTPLGMADTHFVWDEALAGRFAREHDKEGRRIVVPPQRIAGAADDLLTTIGDYGRFAAAVSRGAGLSAKLFKDMTTVQAAPDVAAKAQGPADYGLCWRVISTPQGVALGHGGSDRGVRAGVMIVPELKAGVVVLTNGDNGGQILNEIIPLALPHGGEFLARYIGKK